jgi:hypothetical protein
MIKNFLVSAITVFWVFSANAQKLTAYAITSPEKGTSNWSEVKLVDLGSGETVNAVYSEHQKQVAYSVRTGKQIAFGENEQVVARQPMTLEMIKTELRTGISSNKTGSRPPSDLNHPFATKSAACAFDKKTGRLYYTPLGIAQLRYINVDQPGKVYYFDDKQFGVVSKDVEIPDLITRMVFGADGYGYALTNDANHLVQFNTSNKVTITDLGPLTDAAGNDTNSVHKEVFEGGDMIADIDNNLYLITSNHSVFKISIGTRIAAYLGMIGGLPQKFSTNGAIVEEDDKIIVSSSMSTEGYYRFRIKDLKAEKLSTSGSVYNASDLANGNLLFEKKKKEEEEVASNTSRSKISVYPNPVTASLLRISFENQAPGKYLVQLVEISGKLISTTEYTVTNAIQVQEHRLPSTLAKGSYVINILNQSSQLVNTTKILVQ